jgi:hypothetical protein
MNEPSTIQTKEAGGAPLLATHELVAQRLAAFETAVMELQRRLATLPPAPDWVEQISGAFKDDPAFEEVIALGRASRMAEPFPEPPGVGACSSLLAPDHLRVLQLQAGPA